MSRSLIVVILGWASVASAQGWPLPSKSQGVEVPCPASSPPCMGQEGLPTAAYGPPLQTFVGRFVDAVATRDYQFNFRTARARELRLAPDRKRLYVMLGSALAAYDIDTFFTRLAAGEPLMTSIAVPVSPQNYRSGPPEEFLRWDEWFYAENGAGWQIPLADGQDRLYGFDWDDRGFVYLAYSVYGWGIAKDGGSVGTSSRMQSQYQFVSSGGSDVSPTNILTVKSGGTYTAIVSGESGRANVFDVTNVSTPVRLPDLPFGFWGFAKTSGGTVIGTLGNDSVVRVFDVAGLLAGTPLYTLRPTKGLFLNIDTDGTNFYVVDSALNTPATLYTIAPSASGWRETHLDLAYEYYPGPHVRVGEGMLVVLGYERGAYSGGNLRLYSLSGGVPVEVPLGNYFARYYSRSGGVGYAHPLAVGPTDAVIRRTPAGKTFLVTSFMSLADVYELPTPAPPAPDAGSAPADASEEGQDAAETADAGEVSVDAGATQGAGPDAGSDAGVAPDGASVDQGVSGVCGCGSASALPSGSGLFAILALLRARRGRTAERD